MSEIRTAILKAADWIEGHPDQFNFGRIYIPECGSPGCAIGWIEHFYGSKQRQLLCNGLLFSGEDWQKKQNDFYDSLCSLFGSWEWKNSAKNCAHAMRLYADKYHPAKPSKPSGADICRLIISKPYKELEASNG